MRHISSSISSDALIRHFFHRTGIQYVPDIDTGTTIPGEYQAKKMIFFYIDTAWIHAGYVRDIASTNQTREKGEKNREEFAASPTYCILDFSKNVVFPYPYPYHTYTHTRIGAS